MLTKKRRNLINYNEVFSLFSITGYILEYLTLVPHECKFGLAETGKVFQRTINELPDYSAYRAGIGWAAIARYAGNLLAQPWRKEFKVIRVSTIYLLH